MIAASRGPTSADVVLTGAAAKHAGAELRSITVVGGAVYAASGASTTPGLAAPWEHGWVSRCDVASCASTLTDVTPYDVASNGDVVRVRLAPDTSSSN